MATEMLVGLQVSDPAGYQKYREAMTPLLTSRGGSFGYDFEVSRVLKGETDDPINRVFTIRFPNDDTIEEFFSDGEYLAIKRKFFESSVASTTVIAKYGV